MTGKPIDGFEEIRDAVERAAQRAAEIVAQREEELSRAAALLQERHEADGQRIAELTAEVAGLREAVEFRAIIEQAKGMIMATMRCDADRAFEILTSQSQFQNRKLRVLAQELVALKSQRSPEPPT